MRTSQRSLSSVYIIYYMSCHWSRVQYYVVTIIIITLTAVLVAHNFVVDVYVITREEHWTRGKRGKPLTSQARDRIYYTAA